MTDTTDAETAAADAETTIYAWSDEAPEELIPRGRDGLVIAIAILAAVSAVTAVVAAVVALSIPRPQSNYTLRPAPVEQMPAMPCSTNRSSKSRLM
jgi:hypothetical protein